MYRKSVLYKHALCRFWHFCGFCRVKKSVEVNIQKQCIEVHRIAPFYLQKSKILWEAHSQNIPW